MSVARRPLEHQSTVPGGHGRCVFMGCRGVPPEKLWTLLIDGNLAAEVPMEFLNADGEVYFPKILIREGGSLRTVLQNRWEGEDGNGGYYSLLPHAWKLETCGNPQALRDLVSYAEGTYPLGGHWQRQELPRGTEITVQSAGADLPAVERLRQHFDMVEVQRFSTALRMDNVISADCAYFFFTGCRGAIPRPLTVDARVANGGINFLDTSSKIHILYITIGPRGNLEAVVHNRWPNGSREGYYSLLWHAEALTIKDNPRAVRDLADYVAGRYETGSSQQPMRLLDRAMRLAVEDTAGCEGEIGALAEHFGAIRVDGRRVPGATRRRVLADCNGRERALRPLRAATGDRRRALAEAEGLLAGRLREAERRFDVLELMAR